MRQRTKIIVAFPYSGMEEIVEHYNKIFTVSILRLNEFLVYRRPYTEEEKKEWINEWNKDHLLDGEVAFKRLHKDETRMDVHNDYKERFLRGFYEEINKGTELIFIEATKETIEILNSTPFEIIVIYPDVSMKETWIGRIAIKNEISGYKEYSYVLRKYIRNWDDLIKDITSVQSDKITYIKLSNQKYDSITKELIDSILIM